VTSACCHDSPPSNETSTRVTLRPPPEYAYPLITYGASRPSGTVSSCHGRLMAELMLSSLMMKSGLNHQPFWGS
jgi:hypothetical protein